MSDVSRETFENYLKEFPCDVSRETYKKFELYAAELVKWQDIHNLVSKNSMQNLWERHFLDSAQLFHLVPRETKTMIDLGSGAGFPGLVLALLTNIPTTLIESNGKKIAFLEHVKQITNAPVCLIKSRIELLKHLKAEIVTARALAPLIELLKHTYPFLCPHGKALFLKGETWQNEINVARETWIFDYQLKSSITNDKSMIIIVKNLKKRYS